MGDDFQENVLPIIVGAAAVAIDVALVGATGGAFTAAVIGGFFATGAIAFAVTGFITNQPISPDFTPSGIGGIAGGSGSNPLSPGGKSFAATGDAGFRDTSANPQSPVPICIGNFVLPGTLLDVFPLGESNKRYFSVIGIAKSPIVKNTIFVDDIDIMTLPNYLDVEGGEDIDDNRTWFQFFGSGGVSDDIVLTNSGKKNFNTNVRPGEIGVTPEVYFFDVVTGNNEARIFLSVNVPNVYVDFLQTADADYTGITGKVLSINYIVTGTVVDNINSTTFTDAMITSSPNYVGLNGLTMTFDVDGTPRTATFDAGDIDASNVAAQINTDIGGFVTAVASGTDVIVYNDTHGASGTIVDGGGTASAQLNFIAFNDAISCENNISDQTGAGVTSSVVNVDEIRFESANEDNKRIEFFGTAFDQLGIEAQNYGTTISYTLSKQEKDSITITQFASDENRFVSEVQNGLPQSTNVLLDIQRLETSSASYAGPLDGKVLNIGVAGTTRTVTFVSPTNAATTVIEINSQIGTWVTATVINTTEIRIETTTGGLSASGDAQTDLGFDDADGVFYFDTEIANAGFWTFVLDVSKATNGASINIAIAEVMEDFIQTVDGIFTSIAGQTLILETNDGTQQTITFDGATNTAAEAIIDINNQLGTSVLATASGSEILIEALALPEGTKAIAEVKKVKLIGGTASASMNFKPLYSETKSYNYSVGYAIINLIKNDRISGNPRFTFDITGASNNPAQNLLEIYEGGGEYFGKGINIPNEIDRDSFLTAIDFCNAEGFECDMAALDPSYGEIEKALLDAGSLLRIETGGIYKLIPETDTQVAAELHATDDYKKDRIIRGSWALETIDETQKFNVLRITYPDAEEDFIQRDIVIDVTGEVDTENGVLPQMYENDALININDSEFDFLRSSTYNFPAVTSRSQALRLGIQKFKKQNLGNLGFSFAVSIKDTYLEKEDIVSVFIDELGFTGKQFRIRRIKENQDFGFGLICSEHFSEMYQ